MFLDEMRDDLGIGFGGEVVALLDQLLLQAEIVLDNAIVYDNDIAGAVAMRMSILLRRTPVGSPAGVANAVAALEGLQPDNFFQIAQLAFGASNLQFVPVAGNSDSSRIITAVLEPAQALEDNRNHLLLADVANNATHMTSSRNSVCEGAAKLFNHWIGEHIAGNALDLGLRLFTTQAAIERQFEVLALADLLQAFIAHLLERTLDGLALGIEDAFLERDVNVGFHRNKGIIRQEDWTLDALESDRPVPKAKLNRAD